MNVKTNKHSHVKTNKHSDHSDERTLVNVKQVHRSSVGSRHCCARACSRMNVNTNRLHSSIVSKRVQQ
jgi:hypothetical protein